jgi:hypothetical protein
VTFLELQTEVARRIEESTGSPAFWSVADIKASINRGYRETADVAEWNETSTALSLTASTTYYDLSSLINTRILTVKRIFNDQTSQWMSARDVMDFDRCFQQWENSTGEPGQFLIRGLWWLRFDRYKLATSGTATVYYTEIPADLSADGDTPAFPQEFHYALVEFAVADLLFQDAETKKGMKFWARYKVLEDGLKRYANQRTLLDRLAVLHG